MKKKFNLKQFFVVVFAMCMLISAYTVSASAAPKPKLSAKKKTVYVGKEKAKSQFVLTLKNNSKPVKWSTSKKSVAVVSGSSNRVTITGKKKGTATITARVGKKKYKCKVTVRQYVTSVKLSKSAVTLKKGKSVKLKASVKPSSAYKKSVSWSSSNKKVATVDSKGKVKAKSAGTAVITCKAKDGSGRYAVCKITVPGKATTTKPEKTADDIFSEYKPGAYEKYYAPVDEYINLKSSTIRQNVFVIDSGDNRDFNLTYGGLNAYRYNSKLPGYQKFYNKRLPAIMPADIKVTFDNPDLAGIDCVVSENDGSVSVYIMAFGGNKEIHNTTMHIRYKTLAWDIPMRIMPDAEYL